MSPVKVILNPIAGRGYGSRIEPELRQILSDEGLQYDLEKTSYAGHAIELAAEAVQSGFKTVVAAGGDGTANEVVNGLMSAAHNGCVGTLGLLPAGSGSDFANNVGVPRGLREACRVLADGRTRLVDICRVLVSGQAPRYFDNTVNVGFGGIVTREAQKITWARGMALYLPAVLKTVFLTQAPYVTIDLDGESQSLSATMVCVANGAREGGGFYTAPRAEIDDGLFDVCIVRETTRLAMLGLIPHFIKGTHIGRTPVAMARARRVTISSEDDLIAHMDGEILCIDAHEIVFDMAPQFLRVCCLATGTTRELAA